MLIFKEPIELMGAPGSPYTRKVVALLRYRRIQYRLLPGSRHMIEPNSDRYAERPQPKIPLLPTFYVTDDSGEEAAICDTSPVIRQLESLESERSVIPEDPVMSLINFIVEDFADEWLTKAMFHYRWSYEDDIHKAGVLLPRWNNISADDRALEKMGEEIRSLQISRLRYVGSNETTCKTIEDSFKRFIQLFDKHLTQQGFFFGNRPSSADFAIYGQLTCLALFDPTPQQIVLQQAPRVHAWAEMMEDLSGYETLGNDWIKPSELPETLTELLKEIGRLYVPYLLANDRAYTEGHKSFQTALAGTNWEQSTFPYQVKCLQWIRDEYYRLNKTQQEAALNIFQDTEIAELF